MAVTKTTKTAKDAASTPAQFQIGLADESGVGAGPFPSYMYVAEPVSGLLVTPAQDGVDASGVTPPAGAMGIRGWLSGIYSKLSATLAVTQSGTWTVQPGNSANTTPWLVNKVASTTGGVSTYSAIGGVGNALLTNSVVAVKASGPASLFGVSFVNGGASAAYVQVFDLATSAVVLGTTAPKMSFWIPAGGAWEEKWSDFGIAFAAISIAATAAATGSTAPAAGIFATLYFK